MSYPPVIVQILLALLVVVAALFDSRERRIPNWLALAGLILGVALNTFLFYENGGFRNSLEGLGLAFVIYFPLYLLRGMGAGDVKLMAAVGAVCGWKNWLGIFFFTSILGGIAALILALAKGRLRKTFENIWMILVSVRLRQAPYEGNPQLDVRSDQSLRLPHAVVVAFGTLAFLIAATIWAPR